MTMYMMTMTIFLTLPEFNNTNIMDSRAVTVPQEIGWITIDESNTRVKSSSLPSAPIPCIIQSSHDVSRSQRRRRGEEESSESL